MIERVYLKDYVTFDEVELEFNEVELEFSKGLIVFTGPSGAGKSVLIRGILSIFGYFDLNAKIGEAVVNADVNLEDYGIENDDVLIFKQIKKTKNRFFINNQAVSKKTIREIADKLISYLSLREIIEFENESILSVLDRMVEDKYHKFKLEEYKNLYSEYQSAKNELNKLTSIEKEVNEKKEFLKFEIEKIRSVSPKEGEFEELMSVKKDLSKIEKIKEKIFAMAADIIKLQAKRTLQKPIPVNLDGVDEFIRKASFIHTPDQKRTIEEIKNDFKTKVMDRLLTGDVGFGKTEVAMVASFIIAKSGYQVAVIAPTTILVNQHYESFKERFSNYPDIKIAKLDRFSSSKEKKEILENVKNGRINILIATHAGLNVEYKNLGLVIIDEEHKFGVKQKEKLKALSSKVHTLYMSATPIPRTLNMALSQVKSISTLESAPKNKQNTKTFVKE